MNQLFSVPTGGRPAVVLSAAVLLLASVAAEGADTGSVPMAVAWAVSGCLALAAVAVRPGLFAVVAASGVLASSLVTLVNTRVGSHAEATFGLIETTALLLVVARAVRQLRPRGAVLLAGGAFTALSVQPLRCDPSQYPDLVAFVVPVLWFAAALATVLGLYLRLLDRYRARERMAEMQEQRLEYARDLHDFVGHHVTAIITQAKAVRYTTAAGRPPSPGELDAMLAAIEDAGSQAMRSMRSMVTVLRDPQGPDSPPGAGSTLTELRALVGRFSETGPATELALDPCLAGGGLPADLAVTVHRIVREALTNVRRHAVRATRVTVDVRLEDHPHHPCVLVAVADDGPAAVGQANSAVSEPRSGFGLTGLSERAAMVGGTVTAGPRAGVGWLVEAHLPLPNPVLGPLPSDSDDRTGVTARTRTGTLGTAAPLDT